MFSVLGNTGLDRIPGRFIHEGKHVDILAPKWSPFAFQGNYFAAHDQKLLIILDGLDHIWRARVAHSRNCAVFLTNFFRYRKE